MEIVYERKETEKESIYCGHSINSHQNGIVSYCEGSLNTHRSGIVSVKEE